MNTRSLLLVSALCAGLPACDLYADGGSQDGVILHGTVAPSFGAPPNFASSPLRLALRWHTRAGQNLHDENAEPVEQYVYQTLATLDDGRVLAGPDSWYLQTFDMPSGDFQIGGFHSLEPPAEVERGRVFVPPESGEVPVSVAEIVVLDENGIAGVSEEHVVVWADPMEPLGSGSSCFIDTLIPYAYYLQPGFHLARVTPLEEVDHGYDSCVPGWSDGSTDCLSLEPYGFSEAVFVRLPTGNRQGLGDLEVPDWSSCM